MITPVFRREDTSLFAAWRLEEGGIVSIVVPEVGEIRMDLAKAETLALNIEREVEYGRGAAAQLAAAREARELRGNTPRAS